MNLSFMRAYFLIIIPIFSFTICAQNASWRGEERDGHFKENGHIYGSNWINNVNGNWVCLDWETGEVQYEETWQNKGAIIYSDGMLYCYEEKRGNLALVKPNPEKFDLISSFKTEGSGAHYAHPSIFNGKLLIRHREVLKVYDVSEKAQAGQARF